MKKDGRYEGKEKHELRETRMKENNVRRKAEDRKKERKNLKKAYERSKDREVVWKEEGC